MSNDSGRRRFLPRKKSSIVAVAVAGVIVASGAAAAAIGPDQQGHPSAAAVRAGTAAAYAPTSLWGPHQTDADAKLRGQVTHTLSGEKRAAVKRAEVLKAARDRARALAHRRAVAAAKRARIAAHKASAVHKAHVAHTSAEARRKAARAAKAAAARRARIHRHRVALANAAPKTPVLSGSPKDIARKLLAQRGWSDQFGCLDNLWTKESGWNVHADNPGSDAYGIPQSLPGSKMASAGPDWENDAATQIKWGLGYIADRYGTPCGAWAHSEATNWY